VRSRIKWQQIWRHNFNRYVQSTWIELNEIVGTFIAVVSLRGTGRRWLQTGRLEDRLIGPK
jgi:hypothetical protein